MVAKTSNKVQLCHNPRRLNRVLVRPFHIGLTLNDILPRLAGVKDLTPIDASLGCHNLRLDKQFSYITTFSCPSVKYRYIGLAFVVAPTGDMFQRKTDKLLHGLPNVFAIADDILIAGFDDLCRDNDETVEKV